MEASSRVRTGLPRVRKYTADLQAFVAPAAGRQTFELQVRAQFLLGLVADAVEIEPGIRLDAAGGG